MFCSHEICTYLLEKKEYDSIIRIHDSDHDHSFVELAHEIIRYYDMDCLRYFLATEHYDLTQLQRFMCYSDHYNMDSEMRQYLKIICEEKQEHTTS